MGKNIISKFKISLLLILALLWFSPPAFTGGERIPDYSLVVARAYNCGVDLTEFNKIATPEQKTAVLDVIKHSNARCGSPGCASTERNIEEYHALIQIMKDMRIN